MRLSRNEEAEVPVLILPTARKVTEDTKTVTVIQDRLVLSVVKKCKIDVGEWRGEMQPLWKCDPIYETELFML